MESVVNKHTDRDIDKGIIENIINEYDKLFEKKLIVFLIISGRKLLRYLEPLKSCRIALK